MRLLCLLLLSALLIPCHSYGMEKEKAYKTRRFLKPNTAKYESSSSSESSEVSPFDKTYEILKESSALYLKAEKLKNNKKIDELFSQFKKSYDKKKEEHLDITYCSSRVRIELFRRIIEAKIEEMPLLIIEHYTEEKSYHKFNEGWETMSKDEARFWKATFKDNSYEVIDQIPTYFKIGDFSYKFELWPTYWQPGNGKLYSILQDNRSETYFYIGKAFKEAKIKDKDAAIQNLLKQKKHGKAFTQKSFNGLNLLFDYEVARRAIVGDDFSDLPLIHIMPSLINNLFSESIIDIFLVGEQSNSRNEKVSLFAGKEREEIVKKFILSQENLKNISTLEEAREVLIYSHKSDEDSRETEESGVEIPVTSQPIKSTQRKRIEKKISDETLSSNPSDKKSPISKDSKTPHTLFPVTSTEKKHKTSSIKEEKGTNTSKRAGAITKDKKDKKNDKSPKK